MGEFINSSVLRLLDANLNRAREGLRVLEDYARFVLNHSALSADLKALRHDLATATGGIANVAILHRDTPGDVGTANKLPTEARREDLNHVVTAAGKRLGEALRAIEEYLKTINASAAGAVESIRYRFYAIEQTIARTLVSPARRMEEVRLYVLITAACCTAPWQEAARQAIAGGADCLQLREKEMEVGQFLQMAREFMAICREGNVIGIINDRPDVALLADADGVHVGQEDLPVPAVRRIVGPDKIIGVSTHAIEQARLAVADGADYIGVGPVYPSRTKARDILPGLDYARQVATEISIPAVAIAGITVENVDEVLATGIKAIAVTRAVTGAQDIQSAARELKTKWSLN